MCVCAGEQIEENAYAVVRLLIHHSECLGPALSGESVGLCQIYEDAVEHMYDTPVFGSFPGTPQDSTDLGGALPLDGNLSQDEDEGSPYPEPLHARIQRRASSFHNLNLMGTKLVLSFYTSLVRLLACCAPGGGNHGSPEGDAGKTNLSDSGSRHTSGGISGPSGGTNGHGGGFSGFNGGINGRSNDISGPNGGIGGFSGVNSGYSDVSGLSGRNSGTNDPSGGTSGPNGGGMAGRGCGGVVSSSAMKRSGVERTRRILSNLVSVAEVKGILSLQLARDRRKGIVPAHKEAALLFLRRVYGVTESRVLLELLTDAFLPDIKTALKLAAVSP